MCNAFNHDPWCPCGWGPVHVLFGDMGDKAVCKIFDPFKPALKAIYDAAGETVNNFKAAYRDMGKICDRANTYFNESSKQKERLSTAVKDFEAYEKKRKELTEKMAKAKTGNEKKSIQAQINDLDQGIDAIIKKNNVTWIDAGGSTHAIESLAELRRKYGDSSKLIRQYGMKRYYEDIGCCDGFARDKILRDVTGIDLNKTGEDVIGVKDFMYYCRKNKVDAPMLNELYKYAPDDHIKDEEVIRQNKDNFAKQLAKMVFPSSILFRDGDGFGDLHTGAVVKVNVKEGKLESLVMMHASSNRLSGGIKSWTIGVDELWKASKEYTFKWKDKAGEHSETYRRLVISNIAIHRQL